MDSHQQALDVLINGILTVIDQKLSQASFDKTLQGRVIRSLGNNRYEVQWNGKNYAVPCAVNLTFSPNDLVWVTIPQGVFLHKFISGKVVK